MSTTPPQDPSWWQGADGLWYPPPTDGPEGPTVVGTAGEGPEKRAEHWARGAAGEQATERELLKLPPTFHIVHGLTVSRSGSDIDHVVIGPTGIWVIDSKDWSYPAEVRDGALWCGRYSRQQHVDAVETQAAIVEERLGYHGNAVLCFVGALGPRPAMAVGRARALSIEVIVDHLRSGPVTMGETEIARAVERATSWKERPKQFEARPKAAATAKLPGPSPIRQPQRASQIGGPPARSQGAGMFAKVGAMLLGLGILMIVGVLFLFALSNTLDKARERPSAVVEDGLSNSAAAEFISVSVECPLSGAGYELVAMVQQRQHVRVSATVDGVARYLGEFRTFQKTPPITGVAPGVTVPFEVQPVDDAGQGGDLYALDITTPMSTC